MSFLRHTPRKSRSAVEIDAINRILNKYVDFKELYLKSEFNAEAVEFLENCGDSCLVLHFNEPLQEQRVEIYSVVHGRFIEFEMELVSPAGEAYPGNSYKMRITKCSIALDKREFDRVGFSENRPAVTNIATIKVRERESDFRKSLSVKMIAEEFINKLEGVDVKRVVFKDEKEIPPPVRYVIDSGMPLYLKNLAETDDFFAEHDAFFKDADAAALRENLYRWIQNNAANIHSLLVWPVTYYPLVGEEFTIGCVMIINKDAAIEENQIDRIDAFIRDLSETIRNGNLIESKTDGTILDVSAGGVKIELSDPKLVEKIVSQNVILFEMNFQEDNPLLISGHIVYVFKRDDGGYLVGVDFNGSRFGPKIKSVLPIHIKNFLRQKRG
ncbi:MAG TPA: DUF1577 domain-containing protein [Spirochaetota bacterium]|nr:DUF1577 domain-containing protein [Spirochaetota bacterium]HOD13139.1 DUF1577 domain-containing protein [Spirochaetota bacterium]HPN10522.1 DUF1577 domain-containing protein [Spirochaetota bacterium]